MPIADPKTHALGAQQFATTMWTVVLNARNASDASSEAALQTLCRTYWQPLYFFVRRQGYEPADAEDLTQGFFARLLEKNYLHQVGPEKGRFRSFLLVALRHFISDERDHARALKRGGGKTHLAFDVESAELAYAKEFALQSTPEKLFERRWAISVLAQAQTRLQNECESSGKLVLYRELGPEAAMDSREGYAAVAKRLGLSESAVKSAAFRLRRRYQELIREEIAQTIAAPEEVEAEIRHLLRVLSE
jgi:RNA polymerase sigma factor (sigma-70 family)